MELASRADQRVLRWFGNVERIDDYRMARRVLMAEVSGGREQRNDGGGFATMRERPERVESPGTYVTE